MKWSQWLSQSRANLRAAHRQDQRIQRLQDYYQAVKRLYQRTKHDKIIDGHSLVTQLASYGQRGDYDTRQLSNGAITDIEQDYAANQSIRVKASQFTRGEGKTSTDHPTLDDFLHKEVLLTLENLLMEAQMKEQQARLRTWRAPHNHILKVVLKEAVLALSLLIIGMVFVIGAPTSHQLGADIFWTVSIPSVSVMIALPILPISRVHKLWVGRGGIVLTVLGLLEAFMDFWL